MNRLHRPLMQHLIPGLAFIAALLVLASLGGLVSKYLCGDPWFHGFVPMFDLDTERNVPSVFSTGLIMLCAGVMSALGQRQAPALRRGWQGLSIIFTFLAADELVSIHERLTEPVRASLHTSGLLYLAWLVPYGLGTAAIGAAYLRFLLKLPEWARDGMLLAGTVYIGGAVGIEALEGAYLERIHDQHNLVFQLFTTVEEGLEMTGMIMLLKVLLLLQNGTRGNLEDKIAAPCSVDLAAHHPNPALSGADS